MDRQMEKAMVIEELHAAEDKLQSIARRLDKMIVPFCVVTAMVGWLSCVFAVRLAWPEIETESWFLGEGVTIAYAVGMVSMITFLERKEFRQTEEKLRYKVKAYGLFLVFEVISVCTLTLATLDLTLTLIMEGSVLLSGALFGYAIYTKISMVYRLQEETEEALEVIDQLLVKTRKIQ